MQKIILITGSTDGIGLVTARMLVEQGHHVLLHGRNPAKLRQAKNALSAQQGSGHTDAYLADLSRIADVEALAGEVAANHPKLDVLINNAGIYKTTGPITHDGLDVRFVVNTISPYLLTRRLLPLLGKSGRVVNLSSAAQAPVNPRALDGEVRLEDMAAYAQSKLAITMWSRFMAESLEDGPAVIAVNPGSLLASKMVKEGFGVAGKDIGIGAEILVRAALSDEFGAASGRYFDNDSGRFASPHPDALNPQKTADSPHPDALNISYSVALCLFSARHRNAAIVALWQVPITQPGDRHSATCLLNINRLGHRYPCQLGVAALANGVTISGKPRLDLTRTIASGIHRRMSHGVAAARPAAKSIRLMIIFD